MRTVAALYVDKRGPYVDMEGVDPWTIERDAKLYTGPHPVVAHPPCADWSMLSVMHPTRPVRAACGPRAVEQVRALGGVLEHPAESKLWAEMGIRRPHGLGWLNRTRADKWGGWSLAVDQCAWGHLARKRTWLYVVGASPRDVDPLTGGRPTHVVTTTRGSTKLPEMRKSERKLTPAKFASWLVDIARRAA